MERYKIFINLVFFLIVIPLVFLIVYGYKNINKGTFVNLGNPLNLSVRDVYISDTNVEMLLYNPNNFSVSIIINILGFRNMFGSTAVLTSGGDINIVKTIPPNSYIPLRFDVFLGDVRRVILQWEKGGGYLKVSIYYREINYNVDGIIVLNITK